MARPFGTIGAIAATVGGSAFDRLAQEGSLLDQREEVKASLRELDLRVIVVVDDLDRVEDSQIREVVRLVKLVGDFPNTVYLLSYDPDAVARAVGSGGSVAEGRLYLEKIIQAEHPLPLIADWLIHEELISAVQAFHDAFPDGSIGPLDTDYWQNIYAQGIRPLFSRIREIHRYMNALPVVLESVGSEVAFPDVCAAEAIRMFAPDVWKELPAVAAQQGTQPFMEPDPLEALAKKAGPHERPILSLLQLLLMPDPRRAQARRRLAHSSVMRIYLERARPGTIAPADAVSHALSLAADPRGIRQLHHELHTRRIGGHLRSSGGVCR